MTPFQSNMIDFIFLCFLLLRNPSALSKTLLEFLNVRRSIVLSYGSHSHPRCSKEIFVFLVLVFARKYITSLLTRVPFLLKKYLMIFLNPSMNSRPDMPVSSLVSRSAVCTSFSPFSGDKG